MNFNSKYYDFPEGKDAFGKMVATNKYALAAGLGWGTMEIMFVSKPQGYLPTIGRYIHFVGPFMGMASAFTIATYASTKFRGKDDRINYVIGAIASGGVYGAWKKSGLAGIVAAGAFSVAGILKKMSIEEGWEFFPPMKKHGYGSLFGARHDWTLMEERPKNWTNKAE